MSAIPGTPSFQREFSATERSDEWAVEGPRLSHLLVVQPYFGSVESLRRAIEDRSDSWLGPRVEYRHEGRLRRHLTDLRLRLGDRPGRTTFRKAAFVDVGALRPVGHGYELDVSWRATTMAPLFPVFSGRLAIGDAELRLEGWYAPPGGAVGFVADRALLKIAARGTGQWLLDELVDAADRVS